MARLSSQLIAAAACLPFAAAVVARVMPAAPSRTPSGPLRAPLAFDQYAVNLREVPARPLIQAHFDFTNRGSVPVTITKLEPSCGCLKPHLFRDRMTYEPGDMGRFYVGVHTANEPAGAHAYTVKVHYEEECGTRNAERGMARADSALRSPHSALDAPTSEFRAATSDLAREPERQHHMEVVTFRLTLPERKVSVEPAEIFFYQLSGEPDERTIFVTDYRGERLEVTGAACTSDLVSVTVLPAEIDERGHHRTPIRLKVPGDVPPGQKRAWLTIATSDAEFEKLYAAVLIQGPDAVTPAGFER